MNQQKSPNPPLEKSSKDSPKMGRLGGLSTPRQAPIRAGDRKTTYSNLQEELKFFVVGHTMNGVIAFTPWGGGGQAGVKVKPASFKAKAKHNKLE